MNITVQELKKLAKSGGYSGYSKLRKSDLIKMLGMSTVDAHTNPNRKTKSPRRKTRTPKRKTRTPKRKTRTPRRKTRTPKRKTKSPRRKTRTPKRKTKSPRRKTRSRVPNVEFITIPLPPSPDKNIINVGDYKFIKEHARGDGSCFFHSVARVLYGQKDAGIQLRRSLANNFSFDDYLKLGGGLKAILDLVVTENIDLPDLAFTDMNILNMISKLPEKKKLENSVHQLYEKFVKKFKNTGINADEFMLSYTSKTLGVNIVVVRDDGTISAGTEFVSSYPTIFVYNFFNNHYDPLVAVSGQTKFDWETMKKITKNSSFLWNS